MSVPTGFDVVGPAADELGLSEAAHDYQLTEVREKDAACTRIIENVGGTSS